MKPIRVLIVDDHTLFRSGLVSLLGEYTDFAVVGEASTGGEAWERARALSPDIVLMDIYMPELSGIDATRRITESLPHVRVVMLTVSEQDDDLFEAIKAGAHGYLPKNIEPAALARTLRGVCAGEVSVSRHTAAKIIKEFTRLARSTTAAASGCENLSPREQEVLELLTTGPTNKEIACALGISESTVKNHLKSILEKLHVRNRIQAANFALRNNLASHSERFAGNGVKR